MWPTRPKGPLALLMPFTTPSGSTTRSTKSSNQACRQGQPVPRACPAALADAHEGLFEDVLQVAGHHDMGGQQLPPNQGAHHGGVLRGVHEDGGARQEPPAVPVSLQSLAAEPQHPAGRQQVKHALRDAIEHEKKHALTRTDFQRARHEGCWDLANTRPQNIDGWIGIC